MAKVIGMNTFKEDVLEHKGVVLVDFFATWCGPCKAQGPILDKIASELGDAAEIYKVDIDEDRPLAMEYKVMSVPTLKIFKDGQLMETMVGLQDEAFLKEKLAYYSAS